MVGHETESVNVVTEAVGSFLHEQKESVVVNNISKDRLTGISPENDVIDSSGKMNSWFTCHDETLQQNPQLVNLEA